MYYDRVTNSIEASPKDSASLRRIAGLKADTHFSEPGLWHHEDDEFLWWCIVQQICNRGGTGWYERLKARAELDAFRASVSLKELRKIPPTALHVHVKERMERFHAGRFREDNALATASNFKRLFGSHEGGCEVRRRLDNFDCTTQPIGKAVQASERQARDFLMRNLVFSQQGVEHHVKRKPPSDFLIDVGFARTLIAFDTRMREVFRQVFGIVVTEDNYDPLEDWFLFEGEPELGITPSELDRIIFQHKNQVLQMA
jgi:hypothetical protein